MLVAPWNILILVGPYFAYIVPYKQSGEHKKAQVLQVPGMVSASPVAMLAEESDGRFLEELMQNGWFESHFFEYMWPHMLWNVEGTPI